MADGVTFIRKNGRVIPIRAASGSSRAAKIGKAAKVGKSLVKGGIAGAGASLIAKHGLSKNGPSEKIKVNQGLNAAGLGISIASGALAAASFSGGLKGAAAGHALAHGLDVAGVAANVASVSGRGNGKERAKLAAKQEARNFAIGNAVYAVGVLGFKRNRQAFVKSAGEVAKQAASYGSKVLSLGRRVLRVS